jgi:hypothetical protein
MATEVEELLAFLAMDVRADVRSGAIECVLGVTVSPVR